MDSSQIENQPVQEKVLMSSAWCTKSITARTATTGHVAAFRDRSPDRLVIVHFGKSSPNAFRSVPHPLSLTRLLRRAGSALSSSP